jgi:hypothetical protein
MLAPQIRWFGVSLFGLYKSWLAKVTVSKVRSSSVTVSRVESSSCGLLWMGIRRQALMAALLLFSKLCWAIVKDDFMRVFHNFHEQELFEKSLNTTFIVLIPKKFR